MKREIKFRAYNDQIKKMFDGDEIEESETIKTYLSYGKLVVGCFPKKADYYELIPLQFTGLIDKNGIEIYERDIVRFDNTIMECLWLDGECRFTLHQRRWNEFHDVSSECEIIGNIYENPELLK